MLLLLAWGLLAFSGLIGFVIYQLIAFHDPLAFLKAQDAWGAAPDPLGRLESLLNPPRYLSQSEFGLREIAEGLTLVHAGELTAGAVKMEFGVQFIVNVVASLVALIGLIAATRVLGAPRAVIAWAGWAVFFGYLWFIVSTDQNLLSSPRLLFPAVPLFLGLRCVAETFPLRGSCRRHLSICIREFRRSCFCRPRVLGGVELCSLPHRPPCGVPPASGTMGETLT